MQIITGKLHNDYLQLRVSLRVIQLLFLSIYLYTVDRWATRLNWLLKSWPLGMVRQINMHETKIMTCSGIVRRLFLQIRLSAVQQLTMHLEIMQIIATLPTVSRRSGCADHPTLRQVAGEPCRDCSHIGRHWATATTLLALTSLLLKAPELSRDGVLLTSLWQFWRHFRSVLSLQCVWFLSQWKRLSVILSGSWQWSRPDVFSI